MKNLQHLDVFDISSRIILYKEKIVRKQISEVEVSG